MTMPKREDRITTMEMISRITPAALSLRSVNANRLLPVVGEII